LHTTAQPPGKLFGSPHLALVLGLSCKFSIELGRQRRREAPFLYSRGMRGENSLLRKFSPCAGCPPTPSTGNALPHPTSCGVIQLLPPEPRKRLTSQLHTTAQPPGKLFGSPHLALVLGLSCKFSIELGRQRRREAPFLYSRGMRGENSLLRKFSPCAGCPPTPSTGNALPHPTSCGVIQLLPPEPRKRLTSQLHTTAQPPGKLFGSPHLALVLGLSCKFSIEPGRQRRREVPFLYSEE
jgi:hypothetical protein